MTIQTLPIAAPSYDTQGAKEVRDAVLTSALITLATGLINWGIDTAKRRADERRTKREEAARKADDTPSA